jgi:hypothetical protein
MHLTPPLRPSPTQEMEFRTAPSFMDRAIPLGELQPVDLACPDGQNLIHGELVALLGDDADDDIIKQEARLYQAMARAAVCNGAIKLKWPVMRNRFPVLPPGNDRNWNFVGFWRDMKNLVCYLIHFGAQSQWDL